jgi:hypothetical protein
MILDKKLIQIPGTTLDFYTYEKGGLKYYEFDATECEPPEPMMNTLRGLAVLKSPNERLVGRYIHEPFPLYERIPFSFEYKPTELPNGDFEVVFKRVKEQ